MSNTRQIAHNTMIQIGGKIISTLLGLFAIGMLTRYLGTEKYGWYTTAISFLQFIGILIDFGMTPVTAQMLSEEKTDKTTLLKNLLGFRFVTAVLFLGIAPLFSLLFPYPPEVKQAILLMTVSFLAIAMNQIFMGFYQTKMAMHIQAVGESTGRIVLIIGLWALIAQHAGFLPLMALITFSSLVYTAVLWIWARKFTTPTFAYDWSIWKKIMTKMWPIAISILFNVIYMRGDIIILSTLFPQSEIGLYGAAYRVIDILAQVAMMLMGVMLPVLSALWAEKATAKFAAQYQQAFNAMALIGFPMATGAIMLSTKIMVLVAGKDFVSAGTPLSILALAVAAVFISATFGHTAVAINRQKETMWVYITSAILYSKFKLKIFLYR